MKKFLLALPLAALVACGGSKSGASYSDKDVLMSADIDGMAGWIGDPNALVRGEAHSGAYCLRVDQNHEFSPGYTAVLGQLSPTRIKGVKLEAWVYATDKNSAGKLEFVLKDGSGAEVMRDQTHLEEVKDYGKWVLVSKDIMFPPSTNYTSTITLYASRAGATTPAFVDDIKLIALR
ncbi:MAG: hypothetical protein EOO62_23445 [Hymenobacter sp.]|nr:MAG: hypothetical protein EOO62_23445 [Hymenobacter sp.]